MRIVNRLLAFVAALALVGVGAIIVIEVIAARTHSGPAIIQWHAILDWAHRNTWKADSVELTSAITATAGLVLLLPQLFRRRVSRLRIDTDAGTDAAITRRGVTVTIRGAVAEVEGVASSRVKVGQRRIRVRALSTALPGEVAGELHPKVTEAVSQQLEALRLHKPRRLRVAVNGRSSASHRNGGS
jgi:Family of unknown function (DUF6286)